MGKMRCLVVQNDGDMKKALSAGLAVNVNCEIGEMWVSIPLKMHEQYRDASLEGGSKQLNRIIEYAGLKKKSEPEYLD
ncbi:hypothetical protein ACR9GW_01190 [Enterobacter ludwigii]